MIPYSHAAGAMQAAIKEEWRGEVKNDRRIASPPVFSETLGFPIVGVLHKPGLLFRRQVTMQLSHLIFPLPLPHPARRLFCNKSTCP